MKILFNAEEKGKENYIPHDTNSRVEITPRTWQNKKQLFEFLHWTVTECNITASHISHYHVSPPKGLPFDTCTDPQTPKVGPPTEPFKSLSS